MEPSKHKIVRVIGVYDADGTIIGELTYFWQKTFRGRHCTLCDITHGAIKMRSEWNLAVAELGLEFELLHRDEATHRHTSVQGYQPPCVLAQDESGEIFLLLNSEDLGLCDKSPAALMTVIRSKIDEKTLLAD
ncbi:MAG: hypothetical protein JHD37_09280 [Ilumatobacteraceae bacterium]|nr:hypothetical protein [Ilumatobacteraceae bacterium]